MGKNKEKKLKKIIKKLNKQLNIPIVSNRFKVDIDKVIKTEPKMIKESGFNLFG